MRFAECVPRGSALGLALVVLLPLGAADGGAATEVTALLEQQAAAWNRGDVEAFCSAYAEDAVFVSPSGLTRGRRQVVERYRERYPDRAAMGTLALEVEEVRVAGGEGGTPVAAGVVARWSLSYPDREALAGLTLLVLHRGEDGSWRIVQDASM